MSLYVLVFWSAVVFGFVLVFVQVGVGFVICLLLSISVFFLLFIPYYDVTAFLKSLC